MSLRGGGVPSLSLLMSMVREGWWRLDSPRGGKWRPLGGSTGLDAPLGMLVWRESGKEAMMSLPRPIVTCFVAQAHPDGNVDNITLVTLEEAAARCAAGWAVVGPDPHTEIALNAWIRQAHLALGAGGDGDDHDG